MQHTRTFMALLALLVIGLATLPGIATTWDLSADWSTGANPNGRWTYGYSTETAAGSFTLYTPHPYQKYWWPDLSVWCVGQDLDVGGNLTKTLSTGSVVFQTDITLRRSRDGRAR
jgi:hypothetical protein